MKNLDNTIIVILITIIIIIYMKKYYKKEHFEVLFSPYYPISNQVKVEVNNFDNNINDDRLIFLRDVLKNVKYNANDKDDKHYTFNYANRPIITNSMDGKKIEPITNFLLEAINKDLQKDHELNLIKLDEIGKVEIDDEVKVTFKMICEYKIKNNKSYKYNKQEYKNSSNENNLIIDVEIISIRKIDDEKLHLNTLNIIGIEGDYLPGSNYYKNNKQYLFTESLSNKIIINKNNINNKETNNINETILPNNSEEETTYSDINTEEAESFFDL